MRRSHLVTITSACKLATARRQARLLRGEGHLCTITQNIYFLGFHVTLINPDPYFDYRRWYGRLYDLRIEIEGLIPAPGDGEFQSIPRYPWRIFKNPQLTVWQRVLRWFGRDVLKVNSNQPPIVN